MNISDMRSLVLGTTLLTEEIAEGVDDAALAAEEGGPVDDQPPAESESFYVRAGEALMKQLPPCRLEECLSHYMNVPFLPRPTPEYLNDPNYLEALRVESTVACDLKRIEDAFLWGPPRGPRHLHALAQYYRTAMFARDPRIRAKTVDMAGKEYCEDGSDNALRFLALLARGAHPLENVFFWLMQAYDHYGHEKALPVLAEAAAGKIIALRSLKALATFGHEWRRAGAEEAIANLDVKAYGSRAARGEKDAVKTLVYLHRAGNGAALDALRIASYRNEYAKIMLAMIENGDQDDAGSDQNPEARIERLPPSRT